MNIVDGELFLMKTFLGYITQIMIVLITVVLVLVVVAALFMQHPKFGAKPEGKRLETIKASPHYKDGSFVNRTYTPPLTEGYSQSKVIFNFLFNKGSGTKPKGVIPSVRTDSKNL
ncbi:MAG TPA: hypothetical protein VEZ55_04530, partial [Chitinophagaceae bacterium]|nr:hypothetical protein [Chitinophagaceae bacterium]